MEERKMCIICKQTPSEDMRRYCRRCYLDRRKELYQKKGGTKALRRYGLGICKICLKPIVKGSKNQKYCLLCFRSINKIGNNADNNYENAGGGGYCWKHRKIAEQILNKKLNTNQVVHHIDGNPKNNALNNLIVISRAQHGRLHQYLKEMRASLEKSKDVKDENCWKTLIAQITTTWLETAGVKVLKLSEIGQSAAEASKIDKICHEEGSETMHVPPKENISMEMI